ncbi:MAG: apolipoprotein N-acyltransferase [Burkholderiaceae bacterium]
MRWRPGLPAAVLAALAMGVLHTAAFAPTGLWWLQILALAGLAGLAADAPPRRAALLGGAFGLAWLASGLWWLYISMHDFGHLPGLLAAAAVLLLALFLCTYYAAALALAALLGRGRGPAWRVAIWAACWLLAELGRAVLFSGFPWLAGGYAHTVGPLAAWAPWIGVYGIGALAAGCAAALALLAERQWRPALAMALVVGLGLLLPQDFTTSNGRLRVSLLQPDVPQEQKFDRALMEHNLEALAQQIESARGQLVVTPESVVPLPLDFLDPDYVQRMRRAAQAHPLLLGTFLGDEQHGFVNSLVAFGSGAPYSYGKRHLLPFGESIPPGFHWFVQALGIPMEDQGHGLHQHALRLDGQRLRPLICYEDLFGEDFVQSVQGEDAATILVNVSNLAWFGTLMVQDQHLQFSQMRALEFQRPFIRATNTGATAVLDHRGRVTARLPAATPGVLEAEVEGRIGSTPYARWLHALGLWPLGLVALACLLAARWRRHG